MKRIFLIGYMGTEKTTLGKLIAKEMNLSFIDLDAYIENRYHKSISDIFAEKGEEGFRKIEREMLEEVSGIENVIVATGGGAPCFFDNMEYMNRSGITVYLKSSVKILFSRLRLASSNRPIIKGKSDDELQEFIGINLQKREPFYSKASYTFDSDQLESRHQIKESCLKLVSMLKSL